MRKFEFPASNNQAEYETLVATLKLAKKVGVEKLIVFNDSQVITSQIKGTDERAEIGELEQKSDSETEKALQMLFKSDLPVITFYMGSKYVFHRTMMNHQLEIMSLRQLIRDFVGDFLKHQFSRFSGWMTPIGNYLKFDVLSENEKKARRLIKEAYNYILVHNFLYKRGISTPLLKFVPASNTKEVLEDIHNGICGNHLGVQSLANKVMQAGFLLPSLQKEAAEFVEKCPPCQKHANFHVAPPEELISVISTWPFAKWSLDLLRQFSQAPGQVKYFIMGIDYFTKWIETEPLATITAQRSQKFLYKNIFTRFGVPHSITTNNGIQFTDLTFRNLVADLKIKHQFTLVEHPQGNRQVEVANKVILAEFKRQLQEAKAAWVNELPQVL
ncbi:uncharacterized protein LOC107484944 [Arachis duranensis]|uniref:Uncharacterized protein LOC107484944 n=1 Tax=Arachis duranensis TaxID=130453 RepID=A0A6P4D1R3_ARADU|nr:uncharacterized protein LOC107484944 [Arachis duranensis]